MARISVEQGANPIYCASHMTKSCATIADPWSEPMVRPAIWSRLAIAGSAGLMVELAAWSRPILGCRSGLWAARRPATLDHRLTRHRLRVLSGRIDRKRKLDSSKLRWLSSHGHLQFHRAPRRDQGPKRGFQAARRTWYPHSMVHPMDIPSDLPVTRSRGERKKVLQLFTIVQPTSSLT